MHELDQTLLRASCDQIAPGYDDADFFCAEVRARLLERLGLISLTPDNILDLGTGTGTTVAQLRTHFPAALIVGLDWSMNMLCSGSTIEAPICADAHQLPLADTSVDIVISNMMLPGCADHEQVFREARRVLRNPGLFLFSTLGPDTLIELRYAWSKVDPLPHVHAFADMHNIGDLLVQAGFREPVMDVENLTVNYSDVTKLIDDLRGVAATNKLRERRRGLTTPRLWQRMLQELEVTRNTQGKLRTSVEVIIGQAWTGQADTGVAMHDGEASFPLSRLKS